MHSLKIPCQFAVDLTGLGSTCAWCRKTSGEWQRQVRRTRLRRKALGATEAEGRRPNHGKRVRASPYSLELDHDLDRFAIVHRSVAVGYTLEVRDAVEHAPRCDPAFKNVW